MANYAKRSNYRPRLIVHVAVVENIALSKAMMVMWLLVTGNGPALLKPRSAKKRAHDSSSSTSIDCARLYISRNVWSLISR